VGVVPALAAVPLVLVLTLAGCIFASPSPEPSASDVIATAPVVSPSPSPSPSPSASPSPSPSPEPPPAATMPTPCPGTNLNPGFGPGRQLVGTSGNWAGYVSAVKTRTVTCVEGGWIQPTVTCPTTGHQAVAIWIGIDGFSASSLGIPATDVLVQLGTQATCTEGVLEYDSWHEVLPTENSEVHVPGSIQPGDHLSAKIIYASGMFTMSLFDQETAFGFSVTQAVPGGAPRRTAEWIVEAPATECPSTCAPLPLAKFSVVRFTNAHVTIGGQRSGINDFSWSNVKLTMARSRVTRATVSTLSSGGTAFKVTWVHS
jgi:hypothetical protein